MFDLAYPLCYYHAGTVIITFLVIKGNAAKSMDLYRDYLWVQVREWKR